MIALCSYLMANDAELGVHFRAIQGLQLVCEKCLKIQVFWEFGKYEKIHCYNMIILLYIGFHFVMKIAVNAKRHGCKPTHIYSIDSCS